MNGREDLNKPLIEDRYIEITSHLAKGEVSIIHNFTNIDNAIKTLENVINALKKEKQP